VKTMMKTGVKILSFIMEHSDITREQLSNAIGISIKGVDWQIDKFKKNGELKRIGPDKGGYWKVVEKR
jgi:ATP-dependent DNA helicase RecG